MTMHRREECNFTPHPARCDWCGSYDPKCRSHNDWEEGFSGIYYDVCPACLKREAEEVAAEEAMDATLDDYFRYGYGD